ncbi:MAG: YebB family permuted papain-like enzyme [Burkholderiales bacterium]|nr:YebB family permuted papain-like enzyme [Burkholderiales bacterium]
MKNLTGFAAILWMISSSALAQDDRAMDVTALGRMLHVGDLVFIRVDAFPFRKVASATMSWTNHVGIVVDASGREPGIAESTFPFSRETTFSDFAGRSEGGRIAVSRMNLDQAQEERLKQAAAKRYGIHYDTGFDLYSRGQFCSRFVREIMSDATSIRLGEVESFSELLNRNPHTDLAFWKAWYFGYIPWQRKTVTPASLLEDRRLQKVFDGHVFASRANQRG